ncbi:hypothetical protein P3T42_005921 [Paraburkholderia sp. GAS38]|uniref:hypothetical protein n=1 Tax=Paraburkholderia sp. GAS38 TaxID=3035133 RepID=UPI003D1A4393
MRVLHIAFAALVLAGCNRVHEVEAPADPLAFNYRMCDSNCSNCATKPQSATLHAQTNGTGSLVLKDVEAIGGADLFAVEQCHFYSNDDWHCVVKPDLNMSTSLPNLFAHAWFKREIGFKDGEYYVKNADAMPSIAQKLDPEMIQFEACLTRLQ